MEIQAENKSQILLLNTAKELFWKYGIRRVTVEEICKEAGVSKMTFYRNFKNKDELVEVMVKRLHDQGLASYRSIMDLAKITFEEKVRRLIEFKYQQVTGISKEFVKDIYQSKNTQLAQQLETYQQEMMQTIVEDFGSAQKEGWIRRDLKLGFILYMLQDLNNKILDPQLNALYETEEELIMDLTRVFFYGILAKE